MASHYDVEVTVSSAKELKNINWRHGKLNPYAVVWVDPNSKSSTRVDHEGDTCPYWDETLVIPFNGQIQDAKLYIDIVHADSEADTKPFIGWAGLPLDDIVDEVGYGERVSRKLDLKRSSGRPHGKVEIKVAVRQPRYHAPETYYAPPYPAPAACGNQYGPPQGSYQGAPPVGYGYGATSYPTEEKKKSKFGGMGMGTGLAVGAAAGLLGGLAIAEGVDYVEDKIADDVEERVEDDSGDFE